MILLLTEFVALYAMFIAYSCFEGDREAYFFASLSVSGMSDKYNLHPLFVKQRSVVVLFALCCLPWVLALILLAAFIFTFSFFHDGSYHKKVNDLNPKVYPLRWKAETLNAIEMAKLNFWKRAAVMIYMLFNERKHVSAAFDFTFKTRLVQFGIGLSFFAGGVLYITMNY